MVGDTVEAQHALRLASLLKRQERALPHLRSKLAAATEGKRRDGVTHGIEHRIHDAEHAVENYLFSVWSILKESGKASTDGRRGEVYADYINTAGSNAARRRLQDREQAEQIERMMATGTGRKRRGLKRKRAETPPSFDCQACGAEASRFVDATAAMMVCKKCGVCETFLDFSQACMPFGSMAAAPSSEYKRLNHFTELLAQAQGIEKAEVPQEMIERVRHELLARKITDPALITRARVRQYLKRIKCVRVPVTEECPKPPQATAWRGCRRSAAGAKAEVTFRKVDGSRYYKHTAQIAIALGGRREVMIPDRIHQRLCRLFLMTEPAFEQVCPGVNPADRSNYPNYSLVTRHLLELLNDPVADDLMQHFPVLKSRDKHMEQEAVWCKMCQVLRWQYISHL